MKTQVTVKCKCSIGCWQIILWLAKNPARSTVRRTMAWLMAWPTMALLNDGRVNDGSANYMMAQLHTKSPAKMMAVADALDPSEIYFIVLTKIILLVRGSCK